MKLSGRFLLLQTLLLLYKLWFTKWQILNLPFTKNFVAFIIIYKVKHSYNYHLTDKAS